MKVETKKIISTGILSVIVGTAALGGVILNNDTGLSVAEYQACKYQFTDVTKDNIMQKLSQKVSQRVVVEDTVDFGCQLSEVIVHDNKSNKDHQSLKVTAKRCKNLNKQEYIDKRLYLANKADTGSLNILEMREFGKVYNYELYKSCGQVIRGEKIIL